MKSRAITFEPGKLHPVVDVARVISSSESSCLGLPLRTPQQLQAFEMLRDKKLNTFDLSARKTPADFLFWSTFKIESHLTRLGGIPFRPSELSWPLDQLGNALYFVGQFNFCDSLDLGLNLSGNLLLLFSSGWPLHTAKNEALEPSLHLEWYDWQDIKEPLNLNRQRLPGNLLEDQLSGIFLRHYDYAYDFSDRAELSSLFSEVPFGRWREWLSTPISKISKSYFESQEGWDPREPFEHDLEACVTLYSVLGLGFEEHFQISDESEHACLENGKLKFPGDPGHLFIGTNLKNNETIGKFMP